ncbi:MAG: peptidoglycan DD-metalloendopeptidase family protein [Flavobacterium sp.]
MFKKTSIIENLFKNSAPIHLLANAYSEKDYFPLDLSVSNADLSKINLTDVTEFENYIYQKQQQYQSKIAFGGYLEKRNLYQRSTNFKNDETNERNIHIGFDLWSDAGTAIICPLDGEIHSFKNNIGVGDYGPTIILKHEFENNIFYTLYGHLSFESIKNLKTGMLFKKNQQLATLGNHSENGDYAPHLHFQIIKNIENHIGDYPGVCSELNLDFYLENCPDPNLLLKIKQ